MSCTLERLELLVKCTGCGARTPTFHRITLNSHKGDRNIHSHDIGHRNGIKECLMKIGHTTNLLAMEEEKEEL